MRSWAVQRRGIRRISWRREKGGLAEDDDGGGECGGGSEGGEPRDMELGVMSSSLE